MRDLFLDGSVGVILTQTRRRKSGSLDLFRLRAGLDRMKNKKVEQITSTAHAQNLRPAATR